MENKLNSIWDSFKYDSNISDKEIDLKENEIYMFTNIRWGLNINEIEYNAVEKILIDSNLDYDTYSISFNFDGSSFDYWNRIMEEDNYIHVTITLKQNFDDTDEILNLINFQVHHVLNKVYDIIVKDF